MTSIALESSANTGALPSWSLRVVIAPERRVLFAYTAKHDGAAVDGLLEGTRVTASPRACVSSLDYYGPSFCHVSYATR
jgi:hypothetical protein